MAEIKTKTNKPCCQSRFNKRAGFDPWVGKIPWRRAWQPTPTFLPGESYGQRSLAGYSLLGSQRVRKDWSDLARTKFFLEGSLLLAGWSLASYPALLCVPGFCSGHSLLPRGWVGSAVAGRRGKGEREAITERSGKPGGLRRRPSWVRSRVQSRTAAPSGACGSLEADMLLTKELSE